MLTNQDPSPHLHPRLIYITLRAARLLTLGTLYYAWKFHKQPFPMPRQITAQCGSSLVPRDHLVFQFLNCILKMFKRRALHILKTTGIRSFFVVMNSKQASQLFPATAATLESFDFVQFFDKIQHHNHSTDDISKQLPPCPTEHPFNFSWHSTPLNYYHTSPPTFVVDDTIDNANWCGPSLSTAIDEYDINEDKQNSLNDWAASNPDLTTSDRVTRPATSNTRFQNSKKNRFHRLMSHARGQASFMDSTARLQATCKSAFAVAQRAAADAAYAATEVQSLVTNLQLFAAKCSCILAAQHAAAAAHILAQAAVAAANPSTGLLPRIFSIIDKCAKYHIEVLVTNGWDLSKKGVPKIGFHLKQLPTSNPDRPFALTCKLGIIEHDTAYSSRTVRKAEDSEDTQPALYGSFSLPLAKLIISHAITNSYVSIGELVLKLREGIPQGAKFSSILANLFLADFEDDFMSTFYRPTQKNLDAIRRLGSLLSKQPLLTELASQVGRTHQLPSHLDTELASRVPPSYTAYGTPLDTLASSARDFIEPSPSTSTAAPS